MKGGKDNKTHDGFVITSIFLYYLDERKKFEVSHQEETKVVKNRTTLSLCKDNLRTPSTLRSK